MSEAEYQATDILLPGARVSIFSLDEKTLASGAQMREDWRFARVDVVTREGDVDIAIATYQEQTSPDLLIVQTDDINDTFLSKLGELSSYCEEGTSAIVVGPVNDVYLYRRLIEMGVSDYLVRPIEPEVLQEVVAKSLIASLGVTGSRLMAFIGAKGGVGTSTIAQLAAWNAAKTLGHKTLLMDASGGASSLGVGLGFDPAATLHEVVAAVEADNEDALRRMFHGASEKLSVLSSGADAMLDASVSAAQYEAVLDHLMVTHPLVFVDLSAAEPPLKKVVVARAHHSAVVTSPSVTSLRFARGLLKELADVRGGQSDDISLIVNMRGLSKTHEVDLAAISNLLEIQPALTLKYMPSLFMRYESEIEKIFADKDGAFLAHAFLPILKNIVSVENAPSDVKEGSSKLLGGILGKMTQK